MFISNSFSGQFRSSIDAIKDGSLAHLDVYIAVGVEGAVDHMKGDIDVRYRMKEMNNHRLFHLHDADVFFTQVFTLSP